MMMSANVEIARRRLAAQRLAQPDLATPAEVVRWFGATQAQEYAWSLYAVGLRLLEATEAHIEQAITERRVIRTWPMRGTIHLIPAEDAQWMLRLLARRTNRSAASVYRRAGLSEQDFARAGVALTEALRGGKVLPRRRLYATLEQAGIATDGEQRGLHLLGYWAREGLLCQGPRAGKQPTFTLLDEWIPHARHLDDDVALATLARRYFTSHGPATLSDFAWWAGLTLAEARRGLAQAGSDLAQEVIAEETYWFGAQTATGRAENVPSAWLLPAYDEYTVAYSDRSAILGEGMPANPFVILGPVILVDGLVVGAWRRTLTKDAALLTLAPFAPLAAARREAVEQAAMRYGRFVGLPAIIRWN